MKKTVYRAVWFLTLINQIVMNKPQLEKGSRKYICPSCEKKSFVYYRTADGNIINDTVGRCDRVDNCGYHLPPREWYKDHPTSVSGSSYTNYSSVKNNPSKPTVERIDYVPIQYILDSAKTRNSNFIYFLLDHFSWRNICEVTDQYFLGCTKERAVIYPMIDEKGKCRTAKIQKYDKGSGKRLKGHEGGVNWVHSILKKRGVLSNDFNISLCLFGLHLIRSERNKDKTICICESEKSAIIAALVLPEFVWMAAGALEWLNVDKLKPLKGRTILLFPDTSKTNYAFEKWNKIAQQAKDINIDVSVSNLLENLCEFGDKEKGFDLGDLLINSFAVHTDTQSITQSDTQSATQHKPNQNQEETKPEPNYKKQCIDLFKRQNSALSLLIETFDLIAV